VTYVALRGLAAASSMLILIGVAFFLALGLEPAVSWLVGKKVPRWAAVTAVLFAVIAVLAGVAGRCHFPADPAGAGVHRPGTPLHPAHR